MKELLLKLYYFGNSSKAAFDERQKVIRDIEWEAIKPFIPLNAKFLDVGCGTGYSMKRAIEEFNCDCEGIDPVPNYAGVPVADRDLIKITQAEAENLPFEDSSFDVVYSSHVLEHVRDRVKGLQEMKRVVKPNGVIIIGMPTAAMASLNLMENLVFTTHQRLMNFLFANKLKVKRPKFINVFLPVSHSEAGRSILYDLNHYRIKKWTALIGSQLSIEQQLMPAFYPYPDFVEIFKPKKMSNFSSSVFFVVKA